MQEKKCCELVNAVDDQGLAPIHLAVLSESLEILGKIVQFQATNVNIQDTEYGYSALHLASMHSRNTPMVNLLARASNIDVNIRSFKGDTPLHITVANKNYMATICLVFFTFFLFLRLFLIFSH